MKHFETQIRDFGQQFTEQVKCLDAKVAVDNCILGNILDLYKRRAAIEQDYSDNLLKLNTLITQRNNADNQKRLKWKNYSPATVLNNLLASTQYTAKAHRHLAEIYGKQITQRLVDMQEDCTRLNKKSTDILQKHHAEIIRSLNQLLTKQKDYIKAFNEADEARKRADRAMEQLDREVIRCQDKKKELDKNARVKRLKDEYMERYGLFQTKQAESTIERNKYIIHLVSLKETIDYFYSTELKTIIQCAEYGFHNNLTRLSMNHTSCEEALITVHDSINKLFTTTIEKIDANNDTQVFLDAHKSILTLKENLHFSFAKDDTINKILKSRESVQNCLQNMYVRFNTEMLSITKRVEDDKQSLDSLSKKLQSLINQNDYDVVDYICRQSQTDNNNTVRERTTSLPRNGVSENTYTSIQKVVKDSRMKTETIYFQAMEKYLSDEINKINMTTKLKNVEAALSIENDESDSQSYTGINPNIQTSTAVIIGMKSKLFGGDLNKYSKDTKEMVPRIVRSCIRLINLYGMRNMGVFRVPGSQTEVQTFKSQFELGKDPLKNLKGTLNDVNLAASILKLYFRELDPPIFDENVFEKIVNNYNSVKRNEESVVIFMKELIASLMPPAYATLNYLLSFISHLAEFSTDNCMDILNLAIIFGPCLMPIPEDKSSQLFQYQSIVNHVAQCLITHHQTIFTKESTGPIYQRDQYPSLSQDNDSLKDPQSATDTEKSKFFDNAFIGGSEDELNNLKRNETVRYTRSSERENPLPVRRNSDSEKHCDILAVAVVDYQGKTDQEISFNSGDTILLKKKINDIWWSGHVVKSPEHNIPILTGLVQNAYISIYNHNEMSPDNGSTNQELLKQREQRDGDLSSPESQRLSGKYTQDHKRSMVSIDSDNEVDLSPDDNRSLSHSLENTADLSDIGESKSFGSFENIINDDEDQMLVKSETEVDSEKCPIVNKPVDVTDNQQNMSNIVRIRGSRSSITIYPDSAESTDALDEDLEQTIQGLKRIEELNVIRHRNTVHIDKSLLTSKFISPLNSDHMTIFDIKFGSAPPPIGERPHSSDQNLPGDREFKLKKPGNVSSLTSSFEMTHSPRMPIVRPVEYTNSLTRQLHRPVNEDSPGLPPPVFPKPKLLKK